MFKKIMVPVDLAHEVHLERALTVAADLGNRYHCQVVYVGVTSETPSALAHTPAEFAERLAAFAKAQGEAHGHDGQSHAVASHDPSIDLDGTLLHVAQDISADLIVVASHIPNIADNLWPSHGGRLAARAKASVLVVR